jgi:hypothetical protein
MCRMQSLHVRHRDQYDHIALNTDPQLLSLRLFRLVEQGTRLHFQGLGKFIDDRDRRISRAALEIADVGAVNTCFKRKALLRKPLL